MQVIKRDGTKQDIHFDKILTRIVNLTKMEPSLPNVNTALLTQKVIAGLKDDILTTELDELAADAAIFMSTIHYDYATLASRIAISNLHKQTSPCFLTTCETIQHLLSSEYINNVKSNIDAIQNALNYSLDYQYDYFGFKVLCKSYLLKKNGIVAERPQHLLMRVSVGIHGNDIDNVLKSYDLMSHKYFTHATPTLFNAGTPTPQLASCFLMTMIDDSVEGIYDSVKRSAIISKFSGGQGISVHDIRCEGSKIKSNDGEAGGLVPMLKVFDDCAIHINQGGSKRKGSLGIYLEPHHPDICDFLELKKNTGKEEKRCRNLFYALWNSDLFMNRVKQNKDWSLFCPNECPGLSDVYGDKYVELYERYEREGRAKKIMKAQDLWNRIITSQIETGGPNMLYKDQINKHNNQENLGTIKSSNLCVSGDTFILTNKGQIPIRELQDQQVTIWNGNEWSNTIVRKTGENQELVNVALSNGVNIKCTPYHKFKLMDDSIIEALQLKPKDSLIKYSLPDSTTIDRSSVEDHKIVMKSVTIDSMLNTKLMLQLLGVDSYIVKDECNQYNLIKGEHNIQVVDVTSLEQKEDTFCFNEPKRHLGMFNGVLAGNCTEVVEYTAPDEISVCTLASLGLPAFIKDGVFDHQKLYEACYYVTLNLNKIIDINYYPLKESSYSNLRHRPIGIGIQGLADVFQILKYPYDSPDAKILNCEILETMYFAAATASNDLAKKDGYYSSFVGSPASKGILTPDMWKFTPTNRWNFDQLRTNVKQWGLRNSLLISLMPTATTSSILNNTESFEPLTSNIYNRRVLAGEFIVTNKFLMKELIHLGLWNETLKQEIIKNQGSIQNIACIPKDIKLVYRTVWEISMKSMIDMALERGFYICQSQSFNCYMSAPNKAKLTSMHFYAWEKGLKTGMYYLRTRPATDAIQFTVAKEEVKPEVVKENCNESACDMCGA